MKGEILAAKSTTMQKRAEYVMDSFIIIPLEMEPATALQTSVCIPAVYCDLALAGLQKI